MRESKSALLGERGMFSHRATSGSPIAESTTARTASRTERRTTEPSVTVFGRFTRRTYYALVGARPLALAAGAAATAAATTVTAGTAILARLARRGILRPLDELLRRDHGVAFVLLDEVEADAPPRLVHFLHDHVQDVAAGDHVLDVVDAAGPDVRDVEQTVGALLQLDERAEVGRLDDATGVGVADLGLLRQVPDRLDGGVALRALGGVDEDRAVLLDVDLDLVLRLERADRLAALADDHPDELRVDLDRRDPRSVLGERLARCRDRGLHRAEDRHAGILRLRQRLLHDLAADAGDLDVHLQRRDPLARAGDLEVHVTEVILGALDVGQDLVGVAFLDEAHRDAGDRRRDRHARVHQRERRAADRAHRRGAVRLERLRDDPDRVRELLRRRQDRLERALCERTVADVAPLRRAHTARLTDRVGREVVVVHEPAVPLEREVVDPLPLLRSPERQQRHDLRLPAGEEARAVGPRHHAGLDLDRPDLRRRATVGADLMHRDLLTDKALVDRLARLLDVALRQRVLDDGLTVGRRRTDRERQLDVLDDPLEEEAALGGLELLRVLLSVGQPPQVVLELLAHDRLDRDRALLLEDRVQGHTHLQLLRDVLLRHRVGDRADFLLEDLLDDVGGLAEALLLDARPDGVAVLALEPLCRRRVEPLRLPDLRAELVLRVAELDDLAMCDLERLEELVLGHLVRAGLDHGQAVLRADDDQVEVGALRLLQRRVDHELALDQCHPDRADRPEEGQRRDSQRRRDGVDAENVVRGHHVGREDRGDALRLVAVALREERPHRAVGHPGGEDGALGRAALPLEEPAGDLAGGVHALLDVDRQREEVRAFARLRPALGRAEDDGLTGADDDRSVGLLRQLAALERNLLAADLDGHGNRHPCGVLSLNNAHSSIPPLCCCLERLG